MTNSENEPTNYEYSLMRHACGMDSRTPYYRNYFAAEPGFKDAACWVHLVGLGLAQRGLRLNPLSPYDVYHVTDKGKAYLDEREAKEPGDKFEVQDVPHIEAAKDVVDYIRNNAKSTAEQKWNALYSLQKYINTHSAEALTNWTDGKIKEGTL